MKLLPSSLLAASLALVALAGCSKQDRANLQANTQEAYADTKAALAEGWENVKSYTYEKREDFTSHAKALSAEMEARASKLRAEFSETQASASRKAAMEEFRNAEADYKEKLAALGDATDATWEAAKANVIAAWDRLQAAYHKAMAD